MANVNPIKLTGNWHEGIALDLHTVSSTLVGYDEFGHEVFDTKRSEIGELLYRLKYKSDKSVVTEIAVTAVQFLTNKWKISETIDGLIPVPPSKVRALQPVLAVALAISSGLKRPLYEGVLNKTKETPALKDIYNYQARLNLLQDVFAVDSFTTKGKTLLLFDDLYRSGATLQAITTALYEKGKAKKVFVLTLTKTRSRT